MSNVFKVFRDNIKKLKTFYMFVLNPITLGKIITDINAMIAYKKNGYKPLVTFDDLKTTLLYGFASAGNLNVTG